MASDSGLKKFVRDVFYGMSTAAAPAIAPASGSCESITFGNLNFGFDKYQITPDMEPALEQALTILKNSSCQRFTVTGHTDSVGTDEYNQKLSERRVNAVTTWFRQKGFTGQFKVVGKGELSPKFDNQTEDGRHLNRRVEITTD